MNSIEITNSNKERSDMKQSMKQNPSHSARLLVAACALLFLLSVAPAGFAQQAKKVQPLANQRLAAAPSGAAASPGASSPAAKNSGEEKQEKAAPSKPGSEGIKIHGHWKIDVKNPDGKLVKSVEFENSLVTPNQGDAALAQMFSGGFTLAGWSIYAESTNPNALCPQNDLGTQINECIVVPGPIPSSTYNLVSLNNCYLVTCFGGLTATYVPYNSTTQAAAYFQLQGSFTPTAAGPITSVQTVVVGCTTSGTSGVTISQCLNTVSDATSFGQPPGTALLNNTFTATTLPTPLEIVAGQVVTITVTISFS